jgi:hypothetical protein
MREKSHWGTQRVQKRTGGPVRPTYSPSVEVAWERDRGRTWSQVHPNSTGAFGWTDTGTASSHSRYDQARRIKNEGRPGDWDCPECRFINYASRWEVRISPVHHLLSRGSWRTPAW